MADKSISELPQATQINNDDAFVLQQGAEARRLLGATLLEFLTLNVISVTVTTLPAGSAATATFNKTTGVLALGIPKGDKGAIGEPGAKGDTGATGPANVLSIGTVTSGDAANVSITGEAPNQVLNFVLQKGDKGEKGNTGPANTLSIGSVTSGDTPSASMTGIAPNQELNLVLPKGDPGTAAPTITSITVRQSDYHLIVTLSNGTSYDAGYCRGASGAGTGDMQAETYDPQGKNQDIFAYVDNQVASKLDKTGDGSNATVAFTVALARANIATGEKLSVLLGKIAKWFADLGTLAFKSTVAKSDLAADVQASLGKADSALQSVSKSDVGLGSVDNVKQYSASNPPPYPVTSVNGKTGAVAVPAPPSTTALLKGNGSGGFAAATKDVDYASSVIMRKVTLTVTGWNNSTKKQSVTVSGVLADATQQEITVAPIDASYDSAWNSCGVMCVAQAANSLTFQCGEVPAANIEVYVTVRSVNYQS